MTTFRRTVLGTLVCTLSYSLAACSSSSGGNTPGDAGTHAGVDGSVAPPDGSVRPAIDGSVPPAGDAGCGSACIDGSTPTGGPLTLLSTLPLGGQISVFTTVGGAYPDAGEKLPATELIAVGYDTSYLYEVDWSQHSLVNTWILAGTSAGGNWRGISLVPDNTGCGVDAYLTGCQAGGSCWADICGWPPGMVTVPGSGVQDDQWSSLLVPGTTLFAVSSHYDGTQYGVVEISDYSNPSAAATHVRLDPTTNTYPFNLVATSSEIFAVGQEAAQIGDGGLGPCTACVALYGIDVASKAQNMKVSLGTKPRAPGISADGMTVYVPDFAENMIYVVDVATQSVKTKYVVDDGPVWVTVTPDGNRLLVADWTSNELQLLNASTGALIQTVTVGVNPSQVAMASDGTTVVLGEYGDEDIRFYKLGQ
jgi:YVTN family beta-propeller protein